MDKHYHNHDSENAASTTQGNRQDDECKFPHMSETMHLHTSHQAARIADSSNRCEHMPGTITPMDNTNELAAQHASPNLRAVGSAGTAKPYEKDEATEYSNRQAANPCILIGCRGIADNRCKNISAEKMDVGHKEEQAQADGTWEGSST